MFHFLLSTPARHPAPPPQRFHPEGRGLATGPLPLPILERGRIGRPVLFRGAISHPHPPSLPVPYAPPFTPNTHAQAHTPTQTHKYSLPPPFHPQPAPSPSLNPPPGCPPSQFHVLCCSQPVFRNLKLECFSALQQPRSRSLEVLLSLEEQHVIFSKPTLHLFFPTTN